MPMYVRRSRPSPPFSSGIVTPNSPSSFICSTRSSGYASACSRSEATGMTSRATNFRTVAMTSSRTSGSVAMRVGTVAEQLDDVVVGGLREVGVVHADGLEPVWRLEPHHLVGHRGQVTYGL